VETSPELNLEKRRYKVTVLFLPDVQDLGTHSMLLFKSAVPGGAVSSGLSTPMSGAICPGRCSESFCEGAGKGRWGGFLLSRSAGSLLEPMGGIDEAGRGAHSGRGTEGYCHRQLVYCIHIIAWNRVAILCQVCPFAPPCATHIAIVHSDIVLYILYSCN
jgi:hypothetical protein